MNITVLIADDHPLLRKGLRQMLEDAGTITVVGEAEHGEDALQKIEELNPQIAILDINMPRKNGFEVAAAIREKNLPVDIAFLTMHLEEDIFNRAMDMGARGFVLKENSARDIIDCVRAIAAGKYYVSPLISGFLVTRHNDSKRLREAYPALEDLTPTERSILRLIAEQKTSKEIAELLYVSHKTIENHRTNISNKLQLHGNNSLLKFAIEHKSHLL
jgi:DNA-binding NarL/FixJ family response regulator